MTGTRVPPISIDDSSRYLELRVWAEMFHDAQQARISAVNRAERGGVHPDVYQGHIKGLQDVEHQCSLALHKTFRRTVPADLLIWQKDSPGIGEHLLSRLLGHIGSPYVATPFFWRATEDGKRELVAGEPYCRKVSQLWSYCGVGDPSRRRSRGSTQEDALATGIPLAKSLLRLLAESCVKVNRGPYRECYDAAREKYAERTHTQECKPCGPRGHPAEEGSPWSLAHQHSAALRKVSKEILKDMWVVTRDSYQGQTASAA